MANGDQKLNKDFLESIKKDGLDFNQRTGGETTQQSVIEAGNINIENKKELGQDFIDSIIPSQEEIVKGRDTTISQREPTLFESINDRLPNFLKTGVNAAKDALFGDEQKKQEIRRLQEKGIDVPIQEVIQAEGFFPFLGRTDEEKVQISRNSLMKRGVDPERAEEVAIAEVMARKNVPGSPSSQLFDEMELTDEEEKGVRRARLGQILGGGLDLASFAPVGAAFNTGKTTVASSLKIANKADETLEILRRSGVPNDIARNYSRTFANLTDEAEISKGLDEIDNLMKRTERTSRQATVVDASDDIPVNSYRITENSNLERVNQIDSEINKIRGDRLSGNIDAQTANKRVEALNKERLRVAEENGVALIRDESGKITGTSIRDTGFYAPKEIELHPFRDVEGFAGGQSFNLRDAYISGDNVLRSQMAKTGDIGPLEKIAYEADQAEVRMMDWGNRKAQNVRDIAKRFDLDLADETTDIQTTLALHGLDNASITNKGARQAIRDALKAVDISDEAIDQALSPGFLRRVRGKDSKLVEAVKDGIPESVVNMARGPLKQHFDEVLDEVNRTRRAMGKEEITKREFYAPVLQRTNFWSRMRNSEKTTITDNFDYIIPNAKKNPHAQLRFGGADDLEFRFSNLATRYHESVARDIFDAPVIEQLKAVNKVLKSRGYSGLSKVTERHIREARIGMPDKIDSYLGIKPGTVKREGLQRLNLARTISALSANLVWITTVQPASLVMTAARSGPINLAKGVWEFATNPAARKRIRNLPTIATKRGGKSIGSTGAGDLDVLGGQIVKGKMERFNDFLGKIADANEYWLTGASSLAGEARATKMGLTGEAKKIYADWMGGATQSRYNKTARPLISNSILVRTSFPFQTYAFELYRYSKTLVGKAGGRPLEMTERINQSIMLLSGMYMYNKALEAATGRTLTTPGTFFPLIGSFVDDALNQGARALNIEETTDKLGITDTESSFGGATGRAAAGAIYGDVSKFISAIDAYTRHNNIQPLRKELVKWGMGFSGTPGATQVNRFVDGMIANAQGFQTDREGKQLFRVQGVDKYLSPIVGPYSTRAGIEYFREGGSIVEQDARREKRRLDKLPREEAAKEFDKILGENPALAEQINILNENEENPILGRIREFEAEERVQAIVEEMDKVDEGDRAEEYQKLIDANFGYKSESKAREVANKVQRLLEQKEAASRGEIPDFKNGEPISDKSVVEIVGLFAKGWADNPAEFDYRRAFDIVFSGEGRRLRRVDNGALVVVRDEEWAEETKDERKAPDGTFLDHFVPFQLGGLDRDDNAIIVSRSEWEAYTPVENLLGDHLREGNIGRSEAQKLIKQFKRGEIYPEEIVEKYPIIEGGALGSFSKPFLDRMEQNKKPGQSDAEAFSDEIFRTLGREEF